MNMIQCHLAQSNHPYHAPITPKNPQGTKKGYIQETGLSGTKWITGAYSTPIYNQDRTKIEQSIKTCQDHADNKIPKKEVQVYINKNNSSL